MNLNTNFDFFLLKSRDLLSFEYGKWPKIWIPTMCR